MKRFAKFFIYGATPEIISRFKGEKMCCNFPIESFEFIQSGHLSMNIEFIGAQKSECEYLVGLRFWCDVPVFRISLTDVVEDEFGFRPFRFYNDVLIYARIPHVDPIREKAFDFSKETLGTAWCDDTIKEPTDKRRIEILEKRIADLEKIVSKCSI